MKVVAIGDMHGRLQNLPEADLVLIAGDSCPGWNHSLDYQAKWLATEFRDWLHSLKAKCICGIAGNHDLIFEQRPELVPELPWYYLQDSGHFWHGLHIWGTPWQRPFCDWAFNLPEPQLAEKWALIPAATNILIVHGPPYGFGDLAPAGGNRTEHAGSTSLLERLEEVHPLLTVFGHIHEGGGNVWPFGTGYATPKGYGFRSYLANVACKQITFEIEDHNVKSHA